ncbi:MAG TPA: ABC transporter permease [Balneolaceae bacterium]
MLKNYLKIAFRNLKSHKGYTFINIFGLAIGFAVCIIIALFVQHKLSYDGFHKKAERIYRVARMDSVEGVAELKISQPAPLGPLLEKAYPEVLQAVQFSKSSRPILVRYGAKSFYETGLLYADSSFFSVFSFKLLSGNPQTALQRPYTVVLSESMAEKYFGSKNPLGESIILENEQSYEVTGVIENAPANSSIQYRFVTSFATKYDQRHRMMVEYNGGWNMAAFPTYLLLRSDASASELEKKLPALLQDRAKSHYFISTKYQLEPLSRIYLHSPADNELGPSGDIRYVYIFITVAIMVLLVASANYMNLATASAGRRAREVGVRKTAGASRIELAWQFLGESLLFCIIAGILALGFVQVLLPIVEQLAGISLSTGFIGHPTFIAVFSITILIVGLFSGAYPALVLSAFYPRKVLMGDTQTGLGSAFVRKGMVVFQFAVSVLMLISAAVVWLQLDFIQDKQLGLNAEHVIVIPLQGAFSTEKAETFKQELLQSPQVTAASISTTIPTKGTPSFSVEAEGYDGNLSMIQFDVDVDYLETLGIKLKTGRQLSAQRPTDLKEAVLLNEVAVAELGWKDPVGKTISFGGQDPQTVIGVVENFHFTSFHEKIAPIFIRHYQRWVAYTAVKINTNELKQALEQIEQIWLQFAPNYPFDYFFLNEAFEQLYRSEHRIARIFTIFFCIAIFIACLGLFGLAAYASERRTKEIGIRKVMGATVSNIVSLLSKDFLKLVLIGFVIAVPIAWYFMQQWLQDFAYRIEIGFGIFLLAGALALFIALATVSWQSIRAALANPVDSLRSE